ncbi:MAG: hypothetical protein QXR48_01040 [Candidatus Woesearchaeota archaeon]
MKKADFWFVFIVLFILLALLLLVINIHGIFPTPPAMGLAKSSIPA